MSVELEKPLDERLVALRLESLRLAVGHVRTDDPVGTAICAEVFLEFLMGKSRRTSE